MDLNPAAARMHGYSVEEFRGLEPSRFIHAGSLPVFEQFIETVKAGRDFHGRARDLDGMVHRSTSKWSERALHMEEDRTLWPWFGTSPKR